MPKRGSRQQLLRDLNAKYEYMLDALRIDELLHNGPLDKLSTAELRKLTSAEGVQPRPAGRPPRLPPICKYIDAIKKVNGCGVMQACRLFHRESSVMFLKRRAQRTPTEDKEAAALARRYYREKRG